MKIGLGKRLVTLAVCCACAGGVALAANEVSKTITVQYSNIKLVVDGVPISPKSANGTAAEPFIYNGTTYLPVRAVGEAVGKQVTWDGQSKTVYLGYAPNSKKWLLDLCPPYETKNFWITDMHDPTFRMDGQDCAGLYVYHVYSDNYALFNLNGQYQTLSCDIGHTEGYSKEDSTIRIYLDGSLSQTIDIPAYALAQHFDIPLHNALQLRIVADNYPSNPNVGFANCILS